MQPDPSRTLRECLDWRHEHPTKESRRQHALEIIQSGADIHSVTDHYNKTCLHLAIENSFADVVQLLLEKGIDVNAQDRLGTTALHKSYERCSPAQTELAPMLLYHGADPWIRDSSNATPLDLIFRNSDVKLKECNMVATLEHLCYYMFDQYTEFGLSVDVLLKAAALDLPILQELVGTIKKVNLDNIRMGDLAHILMMPSENLRLLLDKFDCIFKALFLYRIRGDFWCSTFRLENVYVLVASHVQRQFIDWLYRSKIRYRFLGRLFATNAPLASREEIVYCLLSCGMEIDGGDIDTVYKYCGYNELFKLLRFMDVRLRPRDITKLIPRLVFEVTGDIQENIEDPRFWFERILWYYNLDLELVLSYYAVRNLKDMCCGMNMKRKGNFVKKLLDQHRIPLLVEMARNVFRKYFVQRLKITSAKQFYQSLELLPISSHHRKIIALETELY